MILLALPHTENSLHVWYFSMKHTMCRPPYFSRSLTLITLFLPGSFLEDFLSPQDMTKCLENRYSQWDNSKWQSSFLCRWRAKGSFSLSTGLKEFVNNRMKNSHVLLCWKHRKDTGIFYWMCQHREVPTSEEMESVA